MAITILVSLTSVRKLPSKLADAEIVLDGTLTGFRLTGFQVFEGREDVDQLRVTFPAREWDPKNGGPRGYYNYLRPLGELSGVTAADCPESEELKAKIITAYLAEKAKGAKAKRHTAKGKYPPKQSRPMAAPARPDGPVLVTKLPPGPERSLPRYTTSDATLATGLASLAAQTAKADKVDKVRELAFKLMDERDAAAKAAAAPAADVALAQTLIAVGVPPPAADAITDAAIAAQPASVPPAVAKAATRRHKARVRRAKARASSRRRKAPTRRQKARKGVR